MEADTRSVSTIFSQYTPEERAALKQLQEEAKAKLLRDVSLADIISAVEPGKPTPEHMRNL